MIIYLCHIMYLGMTVMTGSDAVGCFGGKDLVGLGLAVGASLFLESGLQESAAAATAEIVGFIGLHINKIFFPYHSLDNISQIVCNRIAKRFSNQLAGVLNRKFDFPVLVPIRRGFEFSFFYPLCVKLNNALDFKIVRDLEFCQSGPDCEEFVPSLRVEPDFTAQVLHSLYLGPYNLFPVFIIC